MAVFQAAAKMSQDSSTSASTGGGRSVGAGWRRGVALAGIAALIVETTLALMQAPRTEPLRDPALNTLDWWRYPIERNAIQRIPVSRGPLRAVYAMHGTDEVWFAGDGGLIVHSRDGGRTWDSTNVRAVQRRTTGSELKATTPPAAAPRRTASARRRSGASGAAHIALVAFEQEKAPYQQKGSPQQQSPAQQAPSLTVPNVIGERAAIAQKNLYGLSLGVSTSNTPVRDSTLAGRVVQQRPAAGTRVQAKTVVDLRIGSYTPPAPIDRTPRPDSPSVALPKPAQAPDSVERFYPRLAAICVTPSGRGWAVGERGVAFRSTDRGRTWTLLTTGTTTDLASLACNDALGAVASGGMSVVWLRADSAGTAEVRSRSFLVGNIAIGAGDTVWTSGLGTLRYSADTARSWSNVGAQQVVAFADSSTRFAVDTSGVVSTSTDGGRSWIRRSACVVDNARYLATAATIVAASARSALALNLRGHVLRTNDGWATCADDFDFGSQPQVAAVSDDIWYAASGGAFRSSDGGRSWQPLINTSRFSTVLFRDSTHGLAGVDDGRIAITSDGGRSWSLKLLSDRHIRPPFLTAIVPQGAMAVEDSTLAFTSVDDGRTWARRALAGGVTPVAFTDAQTAWGLNNDTTQLSTDGGVTWQRATPTGALGGLATLKAFARSKVGARWPALLRDARGDVTQLWLTTDSHALLRYGGTRWDTIASGLRAASPVTPTLAYGLDSLGNLVRSTDGGRAWSAVPPSPPRKYPAPWYYALATLTVVGTLATARARRPVEEESEESIADILVSDRPLREGDRDVLDFGKIAAGLSRFIRNTRTEPPLTIAVTGPWGTGKSSLMNLLRRDLQRRGFRTIWFNAWHHQREESLLASLLEAVRLTATPPVWTPLGVRFRARLLARRFHRYRAALVLLPVFAFAVGYILKDPARRWHDLNAGVESIMRTFGGSSTPAPGAGATKGAPPPAADSLAAMQGGSGPAPRKTLVMLIISIVGTILTYMKGLKAFGVEPGKVAKSVASAGRVRTIESQPAFRYRFAQDFGEVTEALKPERLVIFVDDLDRCKPEQVLEILEAINFLVESGDCVVVLGIDRDRVTGCVAIGFKDVATVLAGVGPRLTAPAEPKPDIGSPAPPAKKDLDYQIEYAQHYLEKLLNMEIPIPPATPTGLGNVMTSSGVTQDEKEDEPSETAEELRDRSRRRRNTQLYASMVAAASVVAFLWGAGRITRSASVVTPSESVIAPPAAAPPDTARTARVATADTTPIRIVDASLHEPSVLVFGIVPTTAWWVHVPLALVAMGALLWLLTPREDNRVEDSAAFATALRAWAPVLFEEHPTPRSAKKFLNKMRFLSMAQRTPTARRAPVESILDRLSGLPLVGRVFGRTQVEEPQDVLPPDAIPEVTLVSLNVIRDRYPEWLRDERFWTSDLHEFVRLRVNPIPHDIAEALSGLGQIETRLNMAQHRDAWRRLELWVRDG